ncbi:ribonuclease H-like domain-containing protein [Tanacetum coccineum]
MIQALEDIMRAYDIDFGGSYHSRIRNSIGPEIVQEITDKVVSIKEKFKAVRDRQKSYADNRRKPLEFEVGDHVLLKVSPWKGVICFGKKGKLEPRYVELFEILERIGLVAYRLRLPEELSSVHDTFYVSNLKKCLADANLHVPLDEIKVDKTLHFVEEPVEIMDLGIKKLKCRKIALVKVSWNSRRGPEFTWEHGDQMRIYTANTQVTPASTQVSTTSTQVSTANLSDDNVYAFLVIQPNGSQLVYEDLKQIHEDDIEEMDLKWQLALLSMRTIRFFQKTGRKITINGSDIAGYDKSKVECFNCHKMGHFARECRGPRNQDSRIRNQDSSRRTVNVEETSSKAMVAIDGAGFDWSYMADDEVPTNMALMAFSDSEFNKSKFNLATYKRGLASVEEQLVFYKKNEVIFWSQITNKSRKGVGFLSYNDVPPPPTRLFSPLKFDLSNSGLEEFQQPEFKGYGRKTSKSVSEDISNEVRESSDALLDKELVSDDKLEKKIVFPIVAKIEFVRPKQQEKPVRKPANCNYHQRERAVSGNNYTRVNYNYFAKKSHPSAHRNMVPRAVLMKAGLRSLNIARPVNTAHPKTTVYSHPQKEDQGYVDSGYSRHMIGNMSYLSDFKEFDGGYVTFGGGAKGGKITGKGTLKTGKHDFEDVYFVKELQFNLFSVSQMCDKKNSVLFTDTGCFVLSPDFKLADES